MFEQYVIDDNVTVNMYTIVIISQWEHDESTQGDAFDAAADFVFIDNDWTLEWGQGYGVLSVSLNLCSPLSHKYLSPLPVSTLVSSTLSRPELRDQCEARQVYEWDWGRQTWPPGSSGRHSERKFGLMNNLQSQLYLLLKFIQIGETECVQKDTEHVKKPDISFESFEILEKQLFVPSSLLIEPHSYFLTERLTAWLFMKKRTLSGVLSSIL